MFTFFLNEYKIKLGVNSEEEKNSSSELIN
jgi:hypothetical protein